MIKATQADVGRRVTYRDIAARKIEEGVISSVREDGAIFVRYGMNASGALTPNDRLEWSTKTDEQTAVRTTYQGGKSTAIDWCEQPQDLALDRAKKSC